MTIIPIRQQSNAPGAELSRRFITPDALSAMSRPDTFVPPHIRPGVERFIEDGILPGSFLQAILRADLRDSCNRADHVAKMSLPSIVLWFENFAPAPCWGSAEAMHEWIMFINKERKQQNDKSTQ